MEDLLFEYKRTLKETKKWYKQLEEADETVLTSEELKDQKNHQNDHYRCGICHRMA